MCCSKVEPAVGSIVHNTPQPLTMAAAIALPDGSISASSLRGEGARGRLVVEYKSGVRDLFALPIQPRADQ